MSIPKITTNLPTKRIYSPFTGALIDGPHGIETRDPSVLFIHYGYTNQYLYISNRVQELVLAPAEQSPDELAYLIELPGAFILDIDVGWRGTNAYGFAPPD